MLGFKHKLTHLALHQVGGQRPGYNYYRRRHLEYMYIFFFNFCGLGSQRSKKEKEGWVDYLGEGIHCLFYQLIFIFRGLPTPSHPVV